MCCIYFVVVVVVVVGSVSFCFWGKQDLSCQQIWHFYCSGWGVVWGLFSPQGDLGGLFFPLGGSGGILTKKKFVI